MTSPLVIVDKAHYLSIFMRSCDQPPQYVITMVTRGESPQLL